MNWIKKYQNYRKNLIEKQQQMKPDFGGALINKANVLGFVKNLSIAVIIKDDVVVLDQVFHDKFEFRKNNIVSISENQIGDITEKSSLGKTLGGAVIGGILTGGVGTIVGAVAGSNMKNKNDNREYLLHISVQKDATKLLQFILASKNKADMITILHLLS